MATETPGARTGVPTQQGTGWSPAPFEQPFEQPVEQPVGGPRALRSVAAVAAVATDWWRGTLTRVLPARDLVAIVLAGCGALAVFVSLLVDWQFVRFSGGETLYFGIADIPTWGTVYVLGAMALIAIFVCVVAFPPAPGRSARVLGIAWALGVAGIVTAMLVRLTGTPATAVDGPVLDPHGGTFQPTVTAVEWEPGILTAAIAIVLLMGAFVAACPPLRDIAATQGQSER